MVLMSRQLGGRNFWGRQMFSELERIAGKVANAPRPPLPGGLVEEVPEEDSPEMLQDIDGTRYLPAGTVIEYMDDQGQFSVRRITLETAQVEGEEPSLIGFCHSRQNLRRFKLDRIKRVLDPHGALLPYPSAEAFLERFNHIPPQPDPEADNSAEIALKTLLRAARHELTVLMFFTRCDGYLHPAERAVIMDFIFDTYGEDGGSPDEVWEVVRRLYPDSRCMLESARAIVSADGSDSLEALQNTIRRLIEADGVIHNNEVLHAMELAYLGQT